MHQCKVDVDMLNTIKSVLADVSSVSPLSEQIIYLSYFKESFKEFELFIQWEFKYLQGLFMSTKFKNFQGIEMGLLNSRVFKTRTNPEM